MLNYLPQRTLRYARHFCMEIGANSIKSWMSVSNHSRRYGLTYDLLTAQSVKDFTALTRGARSYAWKTKEGS